MHDLLEQKLVVSPQCETLIRRSRKQYTVIAVLITIITFTAMASLIHSTYMSWGREFTPGSLGLYGIVFPVLMIAYLALAMLQLYYYFKAISNQNTAVEIIDQDKFEASFRYYVKANRVNIITLSLYLFLEFFPVAISLIP